MLVVVLLVIGGPTVALIAGLLNSPRPDSELWVMAAAGALLSAYLVYAVIKNVKRLRHGA
jgi:hypothetical protein